MKLHELRPPKGAKKEKKRVARGHSAGGGKTAGRGMKGQRARTGHGIRPYFEGGQLPFIRRLPHKRGFTNIFKKEYAVVNLERLNRYFSTGAKVDPQALVEAGIIKSPRLPVKILARGELDKRLTISAHAFSSTARAKIEKAGGKAIILEA